MALLTVQQVVLAGLNPAFQAAAVGGDSFPLAPNTWLEVKNGGAGAVTVTVDSVIPSNYGGDEDVVVSVPAGGERRIGPLAEGRFSGVASVTYSGVDSVTVGAFKV